MAIEQFGKITYNDINNLNNESITTGNIYASGTSADIGTADNPFDKVYANYYYGRTIRYKRIFADNSLYNGAVFEDSIKNYLFILVYCKWANITATAMVFPTFAVDSTYNYYSYTFKVLGCDSNTYQKFSIMPDGKTVTNVETSNPSWTWVIGFGNS